MNKAYITESTNSKGYTFTRLIRGKLNDKDKYWGMRSGLNFRKIIEKEKGIQ